MDLLLVKYQKGISVTHFSANGAWRRVTSFMRVSNIVIARPNHRSRHRSTENVSENEKSSTMKVWWCRTRKREIEMYGRKTRDWNRAAEMQSTPELLSRSRSRRRSFNFIAVREVSLHGSSGRLATGMKMLRYVSSPATDRTNNRSLTSTESFQLYTTLRSDIYTVIRVTKSIYLAISYDIRSWWRNRRCSLALHGILAKKFYLAGVKPYHAKDMMKLLPLT